MATAYYTLPPVASTSQLKLSPLMMNDTTLYAAKMTGPRRTSVPGTVPPTPASAFFDAEEFEAEEYDDLNEGSATVSSGTDTTGPGTPATPSWKPRELTLLRARAASEDILRQESGGARPRKQSRGAVEGLAIEGLELQRAYGDDIFGNEDVLRRGLPISSPTLTPSTISQAAFPRELMLSASAPMTSTRRPCTPANTATMRSRIPVRRGAAFSPKASPALPSSTGSRLPVLKSPSPPSWTKELPSSAATTRDATSAAPSKIRSMFLQQERQRTPSFQKSMEGVGSRKKGVPAPLDLAQSRKNSATFLDVSETPAPAITSAPLVADTSSIEVKEDVSNPKAESESKPAVNSPEIGSPSEPSVKGAQSDAVFEKRSDAPSGSSFLAPPTPHDAQSIASTSAGDDGSILTRNDSPSCESVRPFEYETSSVASHTLAQVADEQPVAMERQATSSSSSAPVEAKGDRSKAQSAEEDSFETETPKLSFNTSIFSQGVPSPERAQILPRDSSLRRSRRSPRSTSKSFKAGPTSPVSPTRHVPDSQYLSAAQLHARRQEAEEAELSPTMEILTHDSTVRVTSPRLLERRSRQLLDALQSPPVQQASEEGKATEAEEHGHDAARQVSAASPPQSPSQTPRSRMMAVPDVPAFSFMMPASPQLYGSIAATPSSSLFPSPAIQIEEEQQGVSRWSSGSEDEDDKASHKNTRRGTKRSALVRRPSPGTNPSGSVLKKPTFLNGLALRKKSVPNLQVAVNELPGSSAASQCSDSPSTSRFDFIEFPFPKQSRPSFSFGRASRPSISGPPSSPSRSASRTGPEQSPSSMSRNVSQITEGSSPADRSPSMSRISTQKSDASLRSVAAMQKSSPTPDCSKSHDSAGLDASLSSADPAAKCLGRRRQASLQSSRSSDSLRARAFTVSRADETMQNEPQQHILPRSSLMGQRKRSMTLDTSLRNDTLARNLEYARLFEEPRKKLATIFTDIAVDANSSRTSKALGVASPCETPRARPVALDSSVDSFVRGQEQKEADDKAEALYNVGQALVARPARRVRRVDPQCRPRYPSLTDYGREWMSRFPEKAFAAALGSALLDWTLCNSSAQGAASMSGHSVARGSDSGTDEYGSSDGRSSDRQGETPSSGASGGDEGPNSQDASFRPVANEVEAELSESDSDSESVSSSDSYGASDNDLPAVDMSRLDSSLSQTAESVDNSSASSDDAPLGQRLREIQSDLPRRSKAHGRRKAKEVPASQYSASMNVGQLDARLQSLQRAQTMRVSTSRAAADRAHDEERSMGHTTSLTRSRRADRDAPTSSSKHGVRNHAREGSADKPLPNIINAYGRGVTLEAKTKTGDAVADFAQIVRARSRSRMGPRPAAIDVSSCEPVPALPRAYQSAINSQLASSNSSLTSLTEQQMAKLSISQTLSPDQRSPTTLGPAEAAAMAAREKVELVLHRVHIGTQQRYTTISIASTARVLDLLAAVLKKESMYVEGQTGGWALHDVCSKLSLERPLREYEALADVVASRTSKTDTFMMRRSDLSPYLNQQAVPSATPSVAGWVYIQDNAKRRSWSKRWLELRNNALYHSKSEKARHPVQLCHLSSFDMYTPVAGEVPSFHAPKRNVFALRSTDAVHLFEDPEKDYAFYFSLTDDNSARQWVTTLLRARSYVLRQEKATLFRGAAVVTSSVPTPGRLPVSAPVKPLLTFAADHYEKGSLLEQQQQQLAESYRAPTAPHTSRTAPLTDAPNVVLRGQAPQSLPLGAQAAAPLDGHANAQAGNARRHEEVMQAERRIRMENKPLIGLIEDMSRYNRTAPGTVLDGSYEAVHR